MNEGGNFGNSTPSGFAEARQEMVETQIRKRHITDVRVLERLQRVQRHEFVPAEFRESAYEVAPLTIGEAKPISHTSLSAVTYLATHLTGADRSLAIGE